jgi:hypothetical protein
MDDTSAPAIRLAWSDRLRRHGALRRAIGARLRRGWLVRFGRVTAWYVAASHAGLVLWLNHEVRDPDASALVVRAVAWMTMAAGLVTLGVTVDVRRVLRAEGVEALLRQRGFSAPERSVATLAATARLVTGTILWPALLLSVVTIGVSHAFSEVVARSLRTFALIAYAPFAAGLLAVLSRWAVVLGPSRPRLLLTAIVVVPYVVAVVTGEGTSLVHLLGSLLDRVERIAGGLG